MDSSRGAPTSPSHIPRSTATCQFLSLPLSYATARPKVDHALILDKVLDQRVDRILLAIDGASDARLIAGVGALRVPHRREVAQQLAHRRARLIRNADRQVEVLGDLDLRDAPQARVDRLGRVGHHEHHLW